MRQCGSRGESTNLSDSTQDPDGSPCHKGAGDQPARGFGLRRPKEDRAQEPTREHDPKNRKIDRARVEDDLSYAVDPVLEHDCYAPGQAGRGGHAHEKILRFRTAGSTKRYEEYKADR